MKPTRNLVGRRFGRLIVIAQAPHSRPTPGGRTFPMWECACDCGSTTVVRGSSLASANTSSCGCLFIESNQSRRKDVVDYKGAHDRVRRNRGRADAHPCIDCGGVARDWSYDGLDPDERNDGAHPSRYSLDPDHYVPRCRRCHVKHDKDSPAATVAGSVETERAQA